MCQTALKHRLGRTHFTSQNFQFVIYKDNFFGVVRSKIDKKGNYFYLVNIFCRLPRSSLANLKLACRDFVWLIEYFDIIAGDSGWRKGADYLGDRCKVCKQKRRLGDSSICRFHPKVRPKNLSNNVNIGLFF